MGLSVAWSFILGAMAYGLFLGFGLAGLVVYNIWNNKILRKARDIQESERRRDSLMDDLNKKELWSNSKLAISSLGLPSDTRVGSQGQLPKLSFDDSFSINTRRITTLSMSTILSADVDDSREQGQQRSTALPLGSENDRSKFSDCLTLGDASALSGLDVDKIMEFNASGDNIHRESNYHKLVIQDTEGGTGPVWSGPSRDPQV